jgi:hypothetical protein
MSITQLDVELCLSFSEMGLLLWVEAVFHDFEQ